MANGSMESGASDAGTAATGPPELERGPRFLKRWAAGIAAAINANRQECITRHQFNSGSAAEQGIDDAADAVGGGGDDLGGESLPDYPSTDGTYVLGVVISDSGATKTLQWLGTDTCP